MITDQQAYDILRDAWPAYVLPNALEEQLQAALCVARFESQYGQSWKNDMVGSNNWGSIRAGKPPARAGYSRLHKDTRPNADGTSTTYVACFREYATPQLGAADLLRVLYVRRPTVLDAAMRGSIQGVAEAMYATGYYEGVGKTVEIRIANYANALWRNYERILKNTSWEARLVRGGEEK